MLDLYQLIGTADQDWIAEKCNQFGISVNGLQLPKEIEDDISEAEICNLYIRDMMEKIVDKQDITEEEKELLKEKIFCNSIDSGFYGLNAEDLSVTAQELVENF